MFLFSIKRAKANVRTLSSLLQQINVGATVAAVESDVVVTKVTSDDDDHEIHEAFSYIPHGASILIGGYLTHQVPQTLIKVLAQAKCHQLTLITNASLLDNAELNSLFKIHGKVARVVTSLVYNRKALLEPSLHYPFQLSVLNETSSCMRDYCYQKSLCGQYALIRASCADQRGNLMWSKASARFFNDSFAKAATHLTFAEVTNEEVGDAEASKVDKCFVSKVIVSQQKELEEAQHDDNTNVLKLIKRLVLEFENNDSVFITPSIARIVESFYMPKHVRVHLLNAQLQSHWPADVDWLHLADKLDLCVVRASCVDKSGHVQVSSTTVEDCLSADVANSSTCKLIVLMEKCQIVDTFVEDVTNFDKQILKRKADLVISDMGVFKVATRRNTLQLVEFADNLDLVERALQETAANGFMPFIDKNNVKLMAQQVF